MGASAAKQLTISLVEKMAPGEMLWDTAVRGLVVRCQRRDKVYAVKYRIHGRQRWITIGPHGALTLDQARRKARAIIGEVAENKDPAERRAEQRDDLSLSELVSIYFQEAPFIVLKGKGRPNKPSRLQTDKSNVNWHILPLIGRLRVRSVTHKDIEDMQRDIAAVKQHTMKKLGQEAALSLRAVKALLHDV